MYIDCMDVIARGINVNRTVCLLAEMHGVSYFRRKRTLAEVLGSVDEVRSVPSDAKADALADWHQVPEELLRGFAMIVLYIYFCAINFPGKIFYRLLIKNIQI